MSCSQVHSIPVHFVPEEATVPTVCNVAKGHIAVSSNFGLEGNMLESGNPGFKSLSLIRAQVIEVWSSDGS